MPSASCTRPRNSAEPRIVVALDFASAEQALGLVDRLNPARCRLKVGKELFVRAGPDLVRREALINFTFRDDFPVPGFSPFTGHWSGVLMAPVTGPYRFLGLTTDDCRLLLDGQEVLFSVGVARGPK